jgi:hypothetical protein
VIDPFATGGKAAPIAPEPAVRVAGLLVSTLAQHLCFPCLRRLVSFSLLPQAAQWQGLWSRAAALPELLIMEVTVSGLYH